MTDLLLTAGHVRTPSGWLSPGTIAIQDGRIEAVTPGPPSPQALAAARRVHAAPGRAAIPALHNAHTHLSQTFMRGLAAGRPLLRWLKELIWPLQAAMSAEELELAALLGLVENIRSGAGRLTDHQKVTATPAHTRAAASAARRSGLRVAFARAWADRGGGAEDPPRLLAELEDLLAAAEPGGLVRFASGPLTPWRCSAETLLAAHALARQAGSFTHIHVAETAAEVDMTLQETGLRPVAWLDALGLLDEACQVVHAVWVDSSEIALLAARRAPVIHCPVSNAVLGSGIAPLGALLQAGATVWLGSDGPASNDTQDLFENMKMALCLARAISLDPAAIPPGQALALASGGAELAPGQPADLALLRLETAFAAPANDLDSALALCARSADVDALLVAGQFILLDGRLTTLDEAVILQEAGAAARALRRRAGVEA